MHVRHVIAALFSLSLLVVGCEDGPQEPDVDETAGADTDGETLGREAEEAAEDVGEDLEEAADDVSEAVDESAHEIDEEL